MSGHIIKDMEQLILSTELTQASTSIPTKICSELTFDRFGDPSHKLIQKAISDIVFGLEVPTISNVLIQLGENADRVGGEPALRGLLNFAASMEVTDVANSWKTAVKLVDAAGRGRLAVSVFDRHMPIFNNLEQLAYDHLKGETIEVKLSNFLNDIEKSAIYGSAAPYKHVSELREKENERLEMESQGYSYNCLPTYFNSLADYGLPRMGKLNVLAGLTGAAKTQLALQMFLGTGLNLALSGSNDYATYNALEDSDLSLYRRMSCCLQGVDSVRLEHKVATLDELKRYNHGLDIIDSLPLYIKDKSVITSQEVLLDQMLLKRSVQGRRIMGVYDYIGLFADEDNQSEALRLTNIAQRFHAYASDNFTCELLLAQYPNLPFGTQIGGLKAKYSGSIADACKVFMEIWNYKDLMLFPESFPGFKKDSLDIPEWADPDFAYLMIHKNTDGKKGNFPLRWESNFTRFSEPKLKASDMYNVERLKACANNQYN